MLSTEAERFDAEFFKLGMHYYAAARSAARSGFMPVCGTLYHHALEMFLKGRLINTYSSEQLKQNPEVIRPPPGESVGGVQVRHEG